MSSWIEETNKKLQDFKKDLRDVKPDWAAEGVYVKMEDVWNPELREQYRQQQENLRDETPITEGGIMAGTDDDFYEKPSYPYDHEITVEFQNDFEENVWDTLMGIFHMLSEKNRKYGDSALNPARIFSKADNVAQLHTRIDDKLNRIKNAQDDEDEDVIADLIGYLILLTIARDNA